MKSHAALFLACVSLTLAGCASPRPPRPLPTHAPSFPPDASTTPHLPPDRAYIPFSSWMALHEQYIRQAARDGIDLLFLGDSITYYWPRYGARIWNRTYAPMRAAAFGIPGDETQHLLWRIEHGELEGLHPKIVVLMIGTNNLGSGMSAEQTAQGVRVVLRLVRAKLPHARIILMGLLPRYNTPAAEAKIPSTNALIARLADGKTVHYLDATSGFTRADGSIITNDFVDGVHPSERGYQMWASTMKPLLSKLWEKR